MVSLKIFEKFGSSFLKDESSNANCKGRLTQKQKYFFLEIRPQLQGYNKLALHRKDELVTVRFHKKP
ncbi:MAG: hypothetical protein CMC70_05780 [Flavobacteriaceae bacterium]|nr:hypothetical protein [Flavobacteriaceae bacterium]|tara:strand:+ start:420 stop:620 length:201 start_codon:yes stop_codon:yes gene_type:complete